MAEEKTLPKLSVAGIQSTSGVMADDDKVQLIVISVLGVESTSGGIGDDAQREAV
jgi:hypothetical protein